MHLGCSIGLAVEVVPVPGAGWCWAVFRRNHLGEAPSSFGRWLDDGRARRRRGRACIIGPLLGGERVTLAGRYYQVRDAVLRPPPRPADPDPGGGQGPAHAPADRALRRRLEHGLVRAARRPAPPGGWPSWTRRLRLRAGAGPRCDAPSAWRCGILTLAIQAGTWARGWRLGRRARLGDRRPRAAWLRRPHRPARTEDDAVAGPSRRGARAAGPL